MGTLYPTGVRYPMSLQESLVIYFLLPFSQQFANEDHLQVHMRKHEMSLGLRDFKSSLDTPVIGKFKLLHKTNIFCIHGVIG